MSACNAIVKALRETDIYIIQEKNSKYLAGSYKKGDKFKIDSWEISETDSGKHQYWVRNATTRAWSLLATENTTYLKIVEDNGNPPLFNGDVVQDSYTNKKGKQEYITLAPESYEITTLGTSGGELTIEHNIPTSAQGVETYYTNAIAGNSWTKSKHNMVPIHDIRKEYKYTTKDGVKIRKVTELQDYNDPVQVNQNSYPVHIGTDSSGRNKYDYFIRIQNDMREELEAIKKNLNIPSAYTRLELNKLFHTKFNRFRVEYPDYFLNNTKGYVAITRPDLNIFQDGEIHPQIARDPQLQYIMNADFSAAKSLTKGFSSSHHFIPLLTNTITSLDVSDENIDTLETGETFTGYKTQYAKSNIRSMTAGTISLKFPETYNMGITHIHQLWCGYESGVYRGLLKPKDKYIWSKILDYACDIYYFLIDVEDMVLRYWCKYTGCFPLNVNKSTFAFDIGSQISHPDINVSYAYFTREDLSILNLNEFNNNSGGKNSSFRYKTNYITSPEQLAGLPFGTVPGNTWSDPPFVQALTVPSGMSRDSKLFALRFRDAKV